MKFVALFRGINVGRAKRIAMADLCATVADLGYTDVRALLNSGNVVFAAPASAGAKAGARIQAAVEEKLGVRSRVTVISAPELDAILAANPLLDVAADPAKLLVAVPAERKDLAKLKPLRARDGSPESLAVGADAAYLWCPGGVSDSALLKDVERALAGGLTSRNWSTMLKLQAATRA